MGAITSFEKLSVVDVPTSDIGGTTAPSRFRDISVQVSATSADTIDVNAAIDKNIQSVEGILYGTVTGVSAGTVPVTQSGANGTALVLVGTGKHRFGIRVSMKAS